MKLGTYSPEIPSSGVKELFHKAGQYGFSQMQFDFYSVCDEEMPEEIPQALIAEIAAQANDAVIQIQAVNGTFNMAHPDPSVRENGLLRLEKIAQVCAPFACNLITLCTGTRNRGGMWLPHPDNQTKSAWDDMVKTMEKAIAIAEQYDVFLGLETEASNVMDTPAKTWKLIDDMQSDRLKVIMDCANLFRPGMARRENVRPVIAEAFDLLGDYVVIAHGKDVMEGDGLAFTGAGQGIVDFPFFFRQLEKIGYRGGLIIHGIKKESDIAGCVAYINDIAQSFDFD